MHLAIHSRCNAHPWLLLVMFCSVFWLGVTKLDALPRHVVAREIEVVLPVWTQVLMAAGDRNLAANVASLRALVVATEKMRPEEYEVLARVQVDASWLNPAHEENYYTAAAILPWVGQLDAAQVVLARATSARYFDYMPAFLYAFHLYHFKLDALGAARWLRDAAEKLPDDDNRLVMQNLAARWVDKVSDLNVAIGVVEALAKQAGRRDFRHYLETRAARLRALRDLRATAAIYRQRFSKPLMALQDLVDTGIIAALPKDPFGFGFDLDHQGLVVLRDSPPSPLQKSQ